MAAGNLDSTPSVKTNADNTHRTPPPRSNARSNDSMPIRTRAQLNVSGMAFRPNENHMDIVNTNVAMAANRSVCHRARIRKSTTIRPSPPPS